MRAAIHRRPCAGPRRRLPALALACCSALSAAGCTAASRVGTAIVTQDGDLPCFALPVDAETRAAPVRLQALAVTFGERADWRSLPPTAWAFRIAPPGTALDVTQAHCLRYGELPARAEAAAAAQALVPGRVYRLQINARPRDGDSPTLGYEASFCLNPGAAGRVTVVTVPWDPRAGRWREEVCRQP